MHRSVNRHPIPKRWQIHALFLVVAWHAPILISQTPESESNRSPLSEQQFESTLDLLAASDLALTEGSLIYRATINDYQWDMIANHSHMNLDYQANPVADLIGQDRSIHKNRYGTQLSLTLPLTASLNWRLGGGFYDGHSNYRSVWIEEYYRQQFANLRGYEAANPHGFNGLTGWRWEYLPGSGILDLNLTYQIDQISPGYDRPLFRPLERGRDRLKTGGISLSVEQVMTPRLRGRIQYRMTDTTARRLRHAGQLSINYSLAEHWVLRASAARTHELNGFRSHSLETTLERDWENRWFLGLGARTYRDNGDIENSLFVVTTAAPSLKSSQFFASLRFRNQRTSIRLEAGPYQTRYAAPNSVVAPFSFLYSERNFFRAGISYTYSF